MFCGECGAKNEKGAAFCGECGKKLVGDVAKKNSNTVKKPNKKTMIIVGIIGIIIAMFVVLFVIFSNITNPKSVAKNYIDAIASKNGNKLYSYLNIEGDSTFVSKKVFDNYIKKELKSNNISNYKITSVDYSNGKLQATVRFSYTLTNGNSESDGKIVLTKKKSKKFLLFDNWQITDAVDASIVKDYTLKVIKGSSLVYGDIKVDKKYLDASKSSNEYDVYVLPQVFGYETNIKAVLPSGLEIEEKVTPSRYYNEHTVTFDEDTLTDSTKNKFTEILKKSLNTIYASAIENKNFDTIKSNFAHSGLDLKKLEQHYSEFMNNLSNESNKLTSFSVTSASIYDIDLNDDGYIEVEFRVNYDYSIKYNDYNNEEKTHSNSDYDYMTIMLSYDKGQYYLVDVDDLETYFSRY